MDAALHSLLNQASGYLRRGRRAAAAAATATPRSRRIETFATADRRDRDRRAATTRSSPACAARSASTR